MNHMMKKVTPFKAQKRWTERVFFVNFVKGVLIIDHSK